MQEKSKFLEMLAQLAKKAKMQGGILSQEEIQEYFGSMELSKEQMDAIYTYLTENRITVKGFCYIPEEKQMEEDSAYLTMYLEDLAYIKPEEPKEIQKLFLRLRSGEEAVKERLTEIWLRRIVELARGYQNQGVFIEDLIQEGNIGLLSGIEMLKAREELLDAEEYLREVICQCMENLIDEAMNAEDLESAVLAKTTLIHEASKVLAEDLDRIATLEELAEYTKIPAEEIADILNLSLDAVKVKIH